MAFEWNKHRFSGGRLALDVANTVILRHDPARSLDRFASPENLAQFPAAAARFCAEHDLTADLAGQTAETPNSLLVLREAIDVHFRSVAVGKPDRQSLSALLIAIGTALGDSSSSSLAIATARSALRLAADDGDRRLRICGACGWLLYDRSKNRGRIWCDMAVCGNREKARRHYSGSRRRKEVQEREP
jgi:predicted RNA-binding Zn ribbon-like protein